MNIEPLFRMSHRGSCVSFCLRWGGRLSYERLFQHYLISLRQNYRDGFGQSAPPKKGALLTLGIVATVCVGLV